MKQHHFMVDKEKTITSALVSLFCILMIFVMAYLGRMISLAVFATIGLVFGYVAAINGAIICLDKSGLKKNVCGITLCRVSWLQVAEAGVCGTNPLNKGRPEKTGRLYIYCSMKKLDEKSRYAMILKWPPKSNEQLYFTYSPQRLDALRLLWDGKLEEYNVGNLCL